MSPGLMSAEYIHQIPWIILYLGQELISCDRKYCFVAGNHFSKEGLNLLLHGIFWQKMISCDMKN